MGLFQTKVHSDTGKHMIFLFPLKRGYNLIYRLKLIDLSILTFFLLHIQQPEWSKLTKTKWDFVWVAHQEKPMTLEDEDRVQNIFIQRFRREIDAELRPVAYAHYKDYLMRSVNSMDPGDLEAWAQPIWCWHNIYIIYYYIILCYIILYYIILYYIIFYYIIYIILYYIILYYIILHYIILYYIILHYITLYYIILHYITLYYIILHYITLYYIILHYIT